MLAVAVAVLATGFLLAAADDRPLADAAAPAPTDPAAGTSGSTADPADPAAAGPGGEAGDPAGGTDPATTAATVPAGTGEQPSTAAPPPAPTGPPVTAAALEVAGPRFGVGPYEGLGAWIDVFDWSWSFTGGTPQVGPADVDRMADLGVRTLFVQVARHDHPADLVDQDLLDPIIARARDRGLRVVAWYLPTFEDPAADLRRSLAAAALPVDGLAIDIESRKLDDVAERNRRLVAYVAALRAALPGQVLGAIVLPPVVMEDVNPAFWPGFPWPELAPHFDVWLPMAYWTDRRADSGWRDGHRYTAVNVDRVRERIGRPGALVHPIGGIGDAAAPGHVAGMVQAALARGAIGGSLYDYRTTGPDLWPLLIPFNR